MKPNEIQLVIPAKLGFEKIVMETAVSLARLHDLPEKRLDDLRTAIAEACINAMEHGNKFERGTSIEVHMRSSRSILQFDVFDLGKGWQVHPEQPDLKRKLSGDESARGWGLFLIEQLVDEVNYFNNHKKGNMTQLSFYLPGKSARHKKPVFQ